MWVHRVACSATGQVAHLQEKLPGTQDHGGEERAWSGTHWMLSKVLVKHDVLLQQLSDPARRRVQAYPTLLQEGKSHDDSDDDDSTMTAMTLTCGGTGASNNALRGGTICRP
jgi:hypothetical protein